MIGILPACTISLEVSITRIIPFRTGISLITSSMILPGTPVFLSILLKIPGPILSVIIRTADANEADVVDTPPWSGSLIRIPYNIDVSDKADPDVTLVKYAGRKRQVSYYGTQLGESSTWRVEIPADDNETLYALRRLMIWTGDVYVREPSGSGYWANVKVSFSRTHCALTIPVTFDITRVEGGM